MKLLDSSDLLDFWLRMSELVFDEIYPDVATIDPQVRIRFNSSVKKSRDVVQAMFDKEEAHSFVKYRIAYVLLFMIKNKNDARYYKRLGHVLYRIHDYYNWVKDNDLTTEAKIKQALEARMKAMGLEYGESSK